MVLGYVVMRVAMVAQWLRAARQNPERRRACLTYVVAISIAQLGWIVLIVANMTLAASAAFAVVLVLIELAGPVLAERRAGGTPWHAHHIAERYGLLVIIALGEGIIGTVAAVSRGGAGPGLVGRRRAGRAGRRRPDLRHVVDVLHDPGRATCCTGTASARSAGATATSRCSRRSPAPAPGCTSPRTTSSTSRTSARWRRCSRWRCRWPSTSSRVYALHDVLVRQVDALHWLLLAGTAVLVVVPVLLAAAGVSMAVCLVVLMFAPVVSVVGYETVGHRHQADAIARDR